MTPHPVVKEPMTRKPQHTGLFRAEPTSDWGNDIWRFARQYGSPGDRDGQPWPTTTIAPRPPWRPRGHRHARTRLQDLTGDGVPAPPRKTGQSTGGVSWPAIRAHWALLLGPVYFLAAGKWRTAVLLLGAAVVAGLTGACLLGPHAAMVMASSAWVGPLAASLAHRAHLLHVLASSWSRRPFQRLSLRRRTPVDQHTPKHRTGPNVAATGDGDDVPAGGQHPC